MQGPAGNSLGACISAEYGGTRVRIEAAHNPEVAGSNPAHATAKSAGNGAFRFLSRRCVLRLWKRDPEPPRKASLVLSPPQQCCSSRSAWVGPRRAILAVPWKETDLRHRADQRIGTPASSSSWR